jgi:branched-chain amino acid transport system substrate-binding protein
MNGVGLKPRVCLTIAMCVALALLVAACGKSSGNGEAGGGATSLACSKEPVKKATGSPLTFGALITKEPGIDFSPESAGVEAYFACLNEHGGIQGHPLKLIVEEEQANPQQATSEVTKLLDSDKVMALVGNMSLIDCSVNNETYAKEEIFVIGAGVDNNCYASPNFSSVSMGPTYAPQLSAQYLLENGVEDSLLASNTLCPGCGAFNAGVLAVGKQAGLKNVNGMLEPLPLTDPNSTALKLIEGAGDGGGATIGWTPAEDLKVMQAIEQQGATEKVHWGCVGICNDATLVESLGKDWNGNVAVPSEYPLLNANTPEMKLYRGVMAKYASGVKPTEYSQMGFAAARIFAQTIEGLPESQLNRKGINEAIVGIKDFKLEMLCDPWYFGKIPVHVPVTAGRIFTPEDGKFVEEQGCTKLEAVTPLMKESESYAAKENLQG